MEKNVKIVLSPLRPHIEVIDKMVMSAHAPYSENDVTIAFNPNIQEYQERIDQKHIKIRQLTVETSTDQTQRLSFDFKANNVHDVKIENTIYNVKLMVIGKENIQGQNFPYFEFFITWD